MTRFLPCQSLEAVGKCWHLPARHATVKTQLKGFNMQNNPSEDSKPWWRYAHMWLVVGGPLVVVVASFYTFYLAQTSPNEIVTDQHFQQRVESLQSHGLHQIDGSESPATQARNHAATGAVPLPSK